MIIAGFSFYILFAVFAVTKNRLPKAGGGWSNPPIFDYLFILGFGICVSVLCVGYTYYAWILSTDDFSKWIKYQIFISKERIERPESDFARAYTHWFFRFVTPIGALLGITIIGFMLISIARYLLK